MKPVGFHPAAASEIDAATDRYEECQPGLGAQFRIDLEAALQRIQNNPLMYAIELVEARNCPLQRFAYSVIYVDLPERVQVVALAHHSRKPGYWRRRKPD